ncbi:SDR family NAD(P)-dependent oxidoreductase [Actinoplanes sp. GCM10030250]|uniref:SDR family NAD(P)-dependent oxidoreductase n=1 Tax=Actinoplanes sp. GCM10030250 TaxID=3273376 RepID=UPI003608FE41
MGSATPLQRCDVVGDARDPRTAQRAATTAEATGPLTGWVNNAAIFRDADLVDASATEILDLITANLALALTGCHTAVNHFLVHHRVGAIVNVSSHQAQRPVRGALPYATAKAAVEGLTRAVAVDHGPAGIRTNAVALGSITTRRFEQYRTGHSEVDAQMAALHRRVADRRASGAVPAPPSLAAVARAVGAGTVNRSGGYGGSLAIRG